MLNIQLVNGNKLWVEEIYKLTYNGNLVAYRLYNGFHEFIDISVSQVGKLNVTTLNSHAQSELLDCADGVLRTEHEIYGTKMGYIVESATSSNGLTWYKWYRPYVTDVFTTLFTELTKKFSVLGDGLKVIEHKISDIDEEYLIGNFRIRVSNYLGEYDAEFWSTMLEENITDEINAHYGGYLKGYNLGLHDVSCGYGDKGWFGVTVCLSDLLYNSDK